MRVLFINRPDARTNYGGDTMQMDRTAQELQCLGVDVEVSVGPPANDQIDAADLVHLFNLQTYEYTHSQLQRVRKKPTALSTIWWDFASDELFSTSAKWRAVRSVIGTKTARTLLHRRIAPILHERRVLHREILRQTALLLPNSVSEAHQLKDLTATGAKVAVVHNGVDTHRVPDHEKASALLEQHGLERKPFILIAGRVEPVKNQLAYIRATSPLGVQVVCVGALTQPYADACRQAGAILLDRQTPETTLALYQTAELHALPSLRETPGLASLEAAAAGTRVLSTNVGSAIDYFGDKVAYCDPHSARSMRTATRTSLRTPKDDKLKEHVEQWTWQRAASETLSAYRQIL